MDLKIVEVLGAVFTSSLQSSGSYKIVTNMPAIKSVHGWENNNFPKLNLISLYFPGLLFLHCQLFLLIFSIFLAVRSRNQCPSSASSSQALKC